MHYAHAPSRKRSEQPGHRWAKETNRFAYAFWLTSIEREVTVDIYTHIHSELLLPLAHIRLTNAAAQLPCGSGETKGGLVLRTHQNARKYNCLGG
jgi:hypothetical protein